MCSTTACTGAGAGLGGSAASSATVHSPSAVRIRSRTRQSGSRTLHFANCSQLASVDEHEALLGMIEEGVDPRRLELAVRAHRLATPDAFLHRIHPAEPSTADSPTTAP